jgi:hypothetical protein
MTLMLSGIPGLIWTSLGEGFGAEPLAERAHLTGHSVSAPGGSYGSCVSVGGIAGVRLTGVYGSGKSSVAAEIGELVERNEVAYGAIDLDW